MLRARVASQFRLKPTALLPGVETNLSVQPIEPVEHGLLIESVPRVIPQDRLGGRRRGVQLLRIGYRYQVVEPSVLQQQRGGRRVPDESNRLGSMGAIAWNQFRRVAQDRPAIWL